MRLTSPRIASTARAFSKPTLAANCPRRALGAVTSASHPATVRPAVSLVVHHSRRLAVERTSPERPAKVSEGDAEEASGDSTELDTRSLPPRWRRILGPPPVPSLSKVIGTLHLNTGARQCPPAPGHRGHGPREGTTSRVNAGQMTDRPVLIPATPCPGDPGRNYRKRALRAPKDTTGWRLTTSYAQLRHFRPVMRLDLCAMIPWRLVEVFVVKLGPVERLNRPSRAAFAIGAQSGLGPVRVRGRPFACVGQKLTPPVANMATAATAITRAVSHPKVLAALPFT